MINLKRIVGELNHQLEGEVTLHPSDGKYAPVPGTYYELYLNGEPTRATLNVDLPVPNEEAFDELVTVLVETILLKK